MDDGFRNPTNRPWCERPRPQQRERPEGRRIDALLSLGAFTLFVIVIFTLGSV